MQAGAVTEGYHPQLVGAVASRLDGHRRCHAYPSCKIMPTRVSISSTNGPMGSVNDNGTIAPVLLSCSIMMNGPSCTDASASSADTRLKALAGDEAPPSTLNPSSQS
eukprot:30357-Rhodomonas_salina.1